MMLWALFACPASPVIPDVDDPSECAGVDEDADGSSACDDCDDDDSARYPGAAERCNGIDDDCDGLTDPAEAELACDVCDEHGAFASTSGLSGPDLETALRELVAFDWCIYDDSRDFMFLDLDNHEGLVSCVYTGRSVAVGHDLPQSDDMNTEHTWPQSQGADVPPEKCDLHHLYPADADANSRRSSYPFGIVSGATTWSENEARLGYDGDALVFQPPPAHRGNVARSMLYFALQYGHDLDPQQQALFVDWNNEDPPDADEIDRTDAIAAYQGNFNAYVVCPYLVDRL